MAPQGKLIDVADLGDTGVQVVADTPHGKLAVGVADGKPFALSNRCRHLGASLGDGCVSGDGHLQCPWHEAHYDVTSGEMVRGPQGAFKPLAGVVKGTMGNWKLKTYPVELREGAIWLK